MKPTSVNEYISKYPEHRDRLEEIRTSILHEHIEESIKWGSPVYGYGKSNLIGIGVFKNYLSVWFFQGALLSDNQHKLINAQEGKTAALRQLRINHDELIDVELIKSYVSETIMHHHQGKTVQIPKKANPQLPNELKNALSSSKELNTAFNRFTESNQRMFAEYIHEAKQSATKERRLEKIIPMILNGIGLNDKYKK